MGALLGVCFTIWIISLWVEYDRRAGLSSFFLRTCPVRRIALSEGIWAGLALAAGVVVLAVLGLHPALAWIPEVPLLGLALLVPLAAFGCAGYRAGRRSGATAANGERARKIGNANCATRRVARVDE